MATEQPSHLGTALSAEPKTQAPLAPRFADASPLYHFLRSVWFRVSLILILIASPLLIYWIYSMATAFPNRLRIGLGPEGGLHRPVMEGLITNLRDDLPNYGLAEENIDTRSIRGSLDAYRGLQFGEFDFALYQSGTAKVLNKIEFQELDKYKDHEGLLSFDEMKWRRPIDESDAQQDAVTRRVFETLGKDPRSAGITEDEFCDSSRIRFVANLYMEVVHFVVRSDADLHTIHDLRPRNAHQWLVALGSDYSGGFAMSLAVLEEFGLAAMQDGVVTELKVAKFNGPSNSGQYYSAVRQAFENGELDAALITMGLGNPDPENPTILEQLLGNGTCRLLPIPYGEALSKKHVLVSQYTIPKGTYRAIPATLAQDSWLSRFLGSDNGIVPSTDIPTIAVRSKLLTRADVDPRLVEVVTREVLNENFQKEESLEELFSGSREDQLRFAQQKPEFSIHDGARRVYHPEAFDIGQFEAWDALYSLLASTIIAAFFGVRWFLQRREIRRGHRMDRWIQTLMRIERAQIRLDTGPKVQHEARLQELLDEITKLRLQVLSRLSAHELKEDPSGPYFVQMCHSLSDKINAKISRQRMDSRFDELLDALNQGD